MNSATFTKLVIIAITLLLLPASQAFAATITTSATCSFENAWASAKGNSNTGGCVAVGAYGDDTIILHANAVIAGGDLTLTNASAITVEGRGFTIDANSNDRHFALNQASTITLNNVKLTGGQNAQPASIYLVDVGGPSTVNINNSVICGNVTTSTDAFASGAIEVGADQTLVIRNSVICNNTGSSKGGGVNNGGNATIINSVFYGNTASSDGGAIYMHNHGVTERLILRHVTITNNTAAHGSGIFLQTGLLEIRNSIIYGNKSGPDCRSHPAYSSTVTVSGLILGTSVDCGNHFTPSSSADPRLIDRTGQNPVFTSHYALSADSPARAARAAAPCLTGNDAVPTDLLGRSRPTSGNCDLGAVVYVPPPTPTPTPPTGNGSGSGSGNGNGDDGDSGRGDDGGSSEDRAAMAPTPVRISPAQTCKDLMTSGIMVSNQSPGTACQLVQQPSGYGHSDLAAAMPSSVVDIWGWITPSTKICFQAASGSIRFIDTTVLPRTLSTLPVFSSDGMLCATIDRAGQVALIADGSPPPTSVPVGHPAERSLSDCMVRTEYSLNFRDAPAGQKIGGVPHNAVLTALARTTDWFKVDYHGAQGWIAARYVAPMGLCG